MKGNKRRDQFEQVLGKSNKKEKKQQKLLINRYINFDNINNESTETNNIAKIEITLDLSEPTQIIQWQLKRITGQEIPLKTIKTLLQFAFKEANELHLIDNEE